MPRRQTKNDMSKSKDQACPSCGTIIVPGAMIYVCDSCGKECCTQCSENAEHDSLVCDECAENPKPRAGGRKPAPPETGSAKGVAHQRLVRGLPRFATLLKSVRGHYSGALWKAGEVVRVNRGFKGKYCIERVKRRPAGILKEGLPLLNELVGVPREALQFHGKSSNADIRRGAGKES